MPEEDKFKGKNKDRHLCKKCRYRLESLKCGGVCDYIGKTGHMRGCHVEDCNKFEGRRRRRKNAG